MSLRVFFYDEATDEQVAVNEAREATLAEIRTLLEKVLRGEGSFVGVLAPDDTMVTYLVTDEGILVDFPIAARRGAMVKIADLRECYAIVAKANGTFDPGQVDGLAFEKY